ncbi:oligosaccharide flippase family protein [Runella limosa]|uniref:oligosaccharide flippase family protein n=1 Tax=Runella limosa TaxID=370978 RepID=UPI0003F57CBC|nr:oligosaccharide flippase family protein [Runella limosa]
MHSRLFINAISSVGQVIISGLTYFLLYGIWVRELGVKQLGVWSIVWTTTYFAAMANSGVPVGIVKFIAEANINSEINKARSIITMSIGITAIINLLICFVLYLNASWLFQFLISSSTDAATAIEIFPIALISFWILNISNVFIFTLDGFQLNYLRSILNITASLCLFISSYFFLNKGLLGIAIAHTIYAIFILIGSISLVVYYLKTPFILNISFNKKLFFDFLNYSIKSQIASITTLLYDPITKFFLAKYSSLDAVGFYEMASRLVTQIRSVIVTANQVMVPKIVETSINATGNFQRLYTIMFKLLAIISTPLLFFFYFFAPFVSLVWIGKIETFFVLSIYILIIGWYLNTLSVPAYISNIGVGQLRHNIIQHITTAVLNVIFGIVGGYFLQGYGVVSAWAMSLAVSSATLIHLFHQKHHLDFHTLRFEGDYDYFISLFILIIGSSISNYILSKECSHWMVVLGCYCLIYMGWIGWIVKNTPFILEMRRRFTNLRLK